MIDERSEEWVVTVEKPIEIEGKRDLEPGFSGAFVAF